MINTYVCDKTIIYIIYTHTHTHTHTYIYIYTHTLFMPGWMNHKLESRLLGEMSTTSERQMVPL